MKRVTFSIDECLIEKARTAARRQETTLGAAFREWLTQFAEGDGGTESYSELMTSLRHVNAGSHFTRDEMNER